MKLDEDLFKNRKIAIVANRAPVNTVKRGKSIVVERGTGGLVASLAPLVEQFSGTWFCTDYKSSQLNQSLLSTLSYKVFCLELSDSEYKQYYEGFSNTQLWPICHYFPVMSKFHDEDWAVYKSVNEKMAKLILENVDDDAHIWIHDYHFMLLPQMLREKKPNLKIGYFLHIPFPNQEVFRLLGNRNELIKGILGSDLIGFHTKSHVEHFVNCAKKLLPNIGFGKEKNTLIVNGRKTSVKDFPISIDFECFSKKAIDEKVIQEALKLRSAYATEYIGISVDRLDYTKGIVERLNAIEHFFEDYPEYIKKVTFVQLSIPSRTEVQAYKDLKKDIDEVVGRVNGRFSQDAWRPIFYIYSTLPFDELVAHYALSDFALVSPLRDGMNLVCKEYVASKTDNLGVLILSEFAGAAEELTESLLVNPYQQRQVSQAIKTAIEMSPKEKTARMQALREKVKSHDVYEWVNNYFRSFDEANNSPKKLAKIS